MFFKSEVTGYAFKNVLILMYVECILHTNKTWECIQALYFYDGLYNFLAPCWCYKKTDHKKL